MKNDVKRFLMCLIASLLSFGTIHAQDIREEQTVCLKDGSELTGVVVRNADGSITVTTRDNDTFYYGANEIRSVGLSEKAVKEAKRQERLAAKQERRNRRDWRQANGRGYMPILETGLGVDRTFLDAASTYNYGDWNYDARAYREDYLAFQIQVLHWINGYSFSPYFYLGAGIGLNLVSDGPLIPFYLHLRTTMSRSRVAPYFALSLGGEYTFNNEEVSPYADVQLGLRIGRKKKAGSWIGLSASYLNPELTSEEYDSWVETTGFPYKVLLSMKYSISF